MAIVFQIHVGGGTAACLLTRVPLHPFVFLRVLDREYRVFSTIDRSEIVVVVGNFGSGKTEIAIHLAIRHKRSGGDVQVADLDIVNPYFRTREAGSLLAAEGIDLVLPPAMYHDADLPIVSAEISGIIRHPKGLALLDVGGNDVGATVLSSLADSFRNRDYSMMQVVNPLRPYTDSIEGCIRIQRSIEAASRLRVTCLAGNANLIDETTPEIIVEGYDFMQDLSRKTGLPLAFITVPLDLQDQVDRRAFDCPVLVIHRQLVPPWKKAVRMSPDR
jgi:energy-coupling factor transporter ATP-binding protein EcfA2